MSLHPCILFIGDRPNPKKNLSMAVPFVGTKSYKTLLEWCYRMNVDVTNMIMINAHNIDGSISKILDWYLEHGSISKVITLGVPAREAVRDAGFDTFALPHPSGANIENNDKKKLAEKLTRCKAWIYREKI